MTIPELMKEANSELVSDSPVKLRNAGRSLCDAFKLLLAEIGRSTFGYSVIAQVRLITRFKFLSTILPELNKYGELAENLDSLRNKTEHNDRYFPKEGELKNWMSQVQSLIDILPDIQRKLKSKQSGAELDAQRNLLSLFLSWLDKDLSQVESAYKSFNSQIPTSIADSVKGLVATRERIQGLTLEEINENLETARELIFEIDQLSTTLDSLMMDAAAESYGPD